MMFTVRYWSKGDSGMLVEAMATRRAKEDAVEATADDSSREVPVEMASKGSDRPHCW